MGAVFSLLFVLIISLLITRVASVALQHTGLSKESAKFQARSAFTGVGFTTTEAESIVRHPVRRRVVGLLMLLGNVGVVTAISSLVLTFVDAGGTTGWVVRTAILLGGVVILWAVSASQWVDVRLSRLIDWALRRYTDLEVRDYAGLLRLGSDYHLIELEVEGEDWLANRNLAELQLRDEGVNVLGITRGDGRYLGVPRGDTEVQPGDTLILYGRGNILQNLDTRRADWEGEQQHRNAVAEQERVSAEQQAEDAAVSHIHEEQEALEQEKEARKSEHEQPPPRGHEPPSHGRSEGSG